MNFLRRLKISTRLIASFLIVAIIAAVIGVISILNMTALNDSDTELYDINTVGLVNVSGASSMYEWARFNALKMTVTEGDVREKSMDNVRDYINQTDAYMTEYSSNDLSDGNRNTFDAAEAQWTEYKGYLEKAMTLMESGEPEQALSYILNDTAEDAANLQDSFQQLFDYNQQEAKVRSDQNSDMAKSSVMLVIIILAAGVLAAIGLGVLSTRSITKPVNAAARQLVKLAEGDDLEELDADKFSGEFRQMVNNMNEVRTSMLQLLEDSGMLVEAAIKGDLSVRADIGRHRGGYRRIVEGVNNTLDAVIEPVDEAAEVLAEMAKGNLNISVKGDYKGEHARIKEALNGTIDTLKEHITDISRVLGEMSKGNLDVSIETEYMGDFMALKTSINSIIDSLNRVLGDIHQASEQVADGTKQVSDGSQEISQGATEQSSAIEELTASVTQIAAQTKQNAMSANNVNELSADVREGAIKGNEQMKAMQQAMTEINEAAENISKIIKVIDDIAFQTNILALNAAVEAARAGVHGKGFAVVAEEVRNLAARSAGAAKETTELIEGSIKKTAAGTKIADETAAALANIVSGIEKAGDLVGEIAAASGEQATAIAQVDRGIEQMSQVVQTNSATSEEAAAAAEELSGQADLLKSMVGQFNLRDKPAAVTKKAVKKALPEMTQKNAGPRIQLSDDEFGKY